MKYFLLCMPYAHITSRSPHGERGLKLRFERDESDREGRSPHGERGLKYRLKVAHVQAIGRSPHGERGLKSKRIGGFRLCSRVALLTESVD